MRNEEIFVTKPFLPPLQEFLPYLESIWASQKLTNGGRFHQELEGALSQYLRVPYVSLFTNASIAIVTALKALDIRGEVITTPFSFVATTNAIAWNGLTPVFVDIDPKTLNIDPMAIAEAASPKTSAILAVHCYGQPCDVVGIRQVAARLGIPVIYDGAHCFGVADSLGSVLRHGDLSVVSFHATKVFNTFEGGAIVSPTAEMKQRVDYLRNFGFVDETHVGSVGINGKMNEVSAAMGLLQLKYVDHILEARSEIDSMYRELLSNVDGLECLDFDSSIKRNFAYFPVLVKSGFPLSRDSLYEKLRGERIFARRYFYPLISNFPMYRDLPSAKECLLPNANSAAGQILCLPIYPGLSRENVFKIAEIIKST
jgi:dTDP-4-amino-4,6-dideoxygalactose transaminase